MINTFNHGVNIWPNVYYEQISINLTSSTLTSYQQPSGSGDYFTNNVGTPVYLPNLLLSIEFLAICGHKQEEIRRQKLVPRTHGYTSHNQPMALSKKRQLHQSRFKNGAELLWLWFIALTRLSTTVKTSHLHKNLTST